MRTNSFESGVSCWEDLQRVSLRLMKCLEMMDSYTSDSLQAGIPITLTEDQIKTKIGITNIALGRSMQHLLQTSFSNGNRGLSDSSSQVPSQEANFTNEGLHRSEISRQPSRRQSVAAFDSPLSMASLDSAFANRSSIAPRPSISASSNDVAHLESVAAAKRSSIALPPQSSASSEEAPLPMATWEAKRSSVAPRPSISASSNDAVLVDSDIPKRLDSNAAKRSSTALPHQSISSSNGASQQVPAFSWEALPFQVSGSQGSPLTALDFEANEEEFSGDEQVRSTDAHHKTEIIAGINARVASERNQQHRLGSLSWAEKNEQGNQNTKVRRLLRVPSKFEAGSASRNQGRDSFTQSDFSRHLLGGSFAQENAAAHESGSFRAQSRNFGLPRNVHNPTTVERSSSFVSC